MNAPAIYFNNFLSFWNEKCLWLVPFHSIIMEKLYAKIELKENEKISQELEEQQKEGAKNKRKNF